VDRIRDIDAHWDQCARVAALLGQGKRVPSNAPELRSDSDSREQETWELERDVCERAGRQYRSIGDALAWQAFGFSRRVIIGLSRNQPSGSTARKKGTEAELSFARRIWENDGHFVLLHDFTSCLRIGDATLFKRVGDATYEAYLHEEKTDQNKRKSRQVRRMRTAEEAIRSGGPLPGDATGWLKEVDVPYKTYLGMLRDGLRKADARGVVGMKVPMGRALVAASIAKGYELWSETEFTERSMTAHEQARKRAGIRGADDCVAYDSADFAGRSPVSPPWAIYPLPPQTCADLITDMSVFFVSMSGKFLVAALENVDLRATWLVPEGPVTLGPDQVVLDVSNGRSHMEMKPSELRQLALELVDLEVWAEGTRALLASNVRDGMVWPHYRNEEETWS